MTHDYFEGFSKLDRTERFARLRAMGAITAEDVAYLQQGGYKIVNSLIS